MLACFFLFCFIGRTPLAPVSTADGFLKNQNYFSVSGSFLCGSLGSVIHIWDLESGAHIGEHHLGFPGTFTTIGTHHGYLVAGAIATRGPRNHNKNYSVFLGPHLGRQQWSEVLGEIRAGVGSLGDRLFASATIMDDVYLTENPYPFMYKEATISSGTLQIKGDGLQFGKLGQASRDLEYVSKSTFLALMEGDIIAIRGLEPKLIRYSMDEIARESRDGTKKETVSPGWQLDLAEWVPPPRRLWSVYFDPARQNIRDAREEWLCSFSEILGLASLDTNIAVCYTTARNAIYKAGECRGRKTGISLFRLGKRAPVNHRWIGRGLLVGVYDGGFLIFWPNKKGKTLRPEIEVWRPW